MRFLIIYSLAQIPFLGTVLGHFSQGNFNIFRRRPAMVAETFTQTRKTPFPTIEKLPTALVQTLIGYKDELTFKMNCSTFVFSQIFLAGRLIITRSHLNVDTRAFKLL